MGLYQLKEFLTLDDVADYLRDKGVYDFDLSQSIDAHRINNLLKDWVLSNKLNLVFGYYGRIDIYNKSFVEDIRKPIDKINPFTNNQNAILSFDENLLKQWLDGQDYLSHKFFDQNLHKHTWEVPVYRLFGHNYSLLDNKDHPFVILLDDCNGEYGLDPLFPKLQIDNILNTKDDSQQQIADLQAKNARLQAHIAELESQLNQANTTPANDDIELTGTSKKAVTKLLYALLREHNYSIDGTIKGATNQALENLTTSHHVPIARETIASWLTEINTLYHNKNK